MRTPSAILLAAALTASACDSKPPAPTPAAKPDTEPATKPVPTPSGAPAVVAEAEGAPPSAAPTPAWFDADKIPHQAITKQMTSQGAVGEGGQATAMILELEAGVTPQQCIERATEALAADLGEVPAATEANGRLTIVGKTDTYSYTVVCGDANGKPTMYLAYNG